MPRRIPDYPDIYWAWNYVSSVGSIVTIFGLFVFFLVLLDIYYLNTYIQIKNYYVISYINNIFVFKKYNFFDIFVSDTIFSYLDKFYYYSFINFIIDSKISLGFVDLYYYYLDFIRSDSSDLLKYRFNIFNTFKFSSEENILNILNYLVYGWLSILIFDLWNPTETKRYISIHFYNIILNKFCYQNMPTQYFFILRYLVKVEKQLLSINKKGFSFFSKN